jgi:predicted acyl esterase
VTGPVKLTLWATSAADDTDWLVWLCDEYPDGGRDLLTKGWLRASHRAVDSIRSKPWQPWHPHTEDRLQPVKADVPTEYEIEVLPTCNVFKQGHRLRLEIASCDTMHTGGLWYNRCLPIPTQNTVLTGRSHPSRLLLPVIP